MIRSLINSVRSYFSTTTRSSLDIDRALRLQGLPHNIQVNQKTAITLGSVFCALRILSEAKASLPLKVYERSSPGSRDGEVSTHPVSYVLQKPNPYETGFTSNCKRTTDVCLWGNNYTEVLVDDRDNVIEINRNHPSTVTPFWDVGDKDYLGRPRLKYQINDGTSKRSIDYSYMIHVPGMCIDGMLGKSIIQMAAQSLGVALASDNTAATFFGNASSPFMVVTVPGALDPEEYARLESRLEQGHTGANAWRPMLLESGTTAAFASMPLKDVQFLESRKFQGEEIAGRWFGIFPHLSGYYDRITGDFDQLDKLFVTYTLMPYLIREEQELNFKLFNREERQRYYVKYNVNGLLRGKQAERYTAHKTGLEGAFLTVNEVRSMEDMPPVVGGDELWKPAYLWGKSENVQDKNKQEPKA